MDYPYALVRSTWLLFRMHLGTILGSRRTLGGIALALIPPVLGLLASQLAPDHVRSNEMFGKLGFVLLLSFVVPMLGVSLGVGVVADEAESRTITYPFTRPIPRPALFLGRWFATVTCALGLIAGSVLLLSVAVSLRDGMPEPRVLGNVMRACLVGGVLYSLGAAVIGIVFKRGLIIALAYAFAIEVLLANVPGSSQKLTLQYYVRSLFLEGGVPGLEGEQLFDPANFGDPSVVTVQLIATAAVLLVIGIWAIRRKQFVLSA